ncbi:MAG: TolC family protein [Dysgonamonadaceae bacterium]|jgi:outer membrane protein TolC|nr:TolC family protein [Dysgonamonadaceae bacterium]
MKTVICFIFLLFGCVATASAQRTLDECQQKAKENYPLIKKYSLIEQSKAFSLANAAKAWLPQFQLNARATLQSEVTKIPLDFSSLGAIGISVPEIPTLAKDQYQATLEASQVLWDGGAIRAQQKVIQAGSEVERTQWEVEMYALEERVNQLFFGILLLNEQLKQNRLLLDELARNDTTIRHSIENGIANPSDLDVIKVEQLNAKQVRTQLESSRKAFVDMLGIMTGEALTEKTTFVKPDADHAVGTSLIRSSPINRPELQLFDAQNNLFDSQKSLLQAAWMPKLGLFLQGGYGRPGLNMLSDQFDPFYIGGVRLSWNFGALYTQKNDLRKIEINKNVVDTQKELFLYNISLMVSRENREIERLRQLMQDDDEIIALRESIRKATEAKVVNGTATVTDLMRELTHENLARQTQAAHEIDLLMAIYNLKNTTNN